MKSLPFFWVDAFTSQALSGNPCAVILGADELSDQQMQKLAREMNLSETAFVMRSSCADVKARYFTPEEEIPLAGHPTISIMHVLVETGRLSVPRDLRLELSAGVVSVNLEAVAGSGPLITMSQLKPTFLRSYSPADLAPLFGLGGDDFLAGAKIQTVSTGTAFLMVPLKDHRALKKVSIDVAAFREFRRAADFTTPHFFCLEGATAAGRTFARHPGLPPETAEDPFTGSATGCMGAYLWRYQFIESAKFIAEQGHWMGRPGTAQVEVLGAHDNIQGVKVAGSAVTVIRGEIAL